MFRRYRGSWPQVMYLKASNVESPDVFGTMVDVGDDGTTIGVGVPYESSGASGINGDRTDNSQAYAGAIYVFEGTY